MELDWQQAGEFMGHPIYEAELVAYETPRGPAIATFTVKSETYFPSTCCYKALLYDPYVDELVGNGYISYCKGNKIEGDWEASCDACMDVCEGYGVEQTGNSPFTAPWEYGHHLYDEKMLRAMAEEWCEENEGEFMHEWLGCSYIPSGGGAYELAFTVLEGGYEPVDIRLTVYDDYEIVAGVS